MWTFDWSRTEYQTRGNLFHDIIRSLKQIFPMHHFSLTLFEPQDTEDKSAAIHACDGS